MNVGWLVRRIPTSPFKDAHQDLCGSVPLERREHDKHWNQGRFGPINRRIRSLEAAVCRASRLFWFAPRSATRSRPLIRASR